MTPNKQAIISPKTGREKLQQHTPQAHHEVEVNFQLHKHDPQDHATAMPHHQADK